MPSVLVLNQCHQPKVLAAISQLCHRVYIYNNRRVYNDGLGFQVS